MSVEKVGPSGNGRGCTAVRFSRCFVSGHDSPTTFFPGESSPNTGPKEQR